MKELDHEQRLKAVAKAINEMQVIAFNLVREQIAKEFLDEAYQYGVRAGKEDTLQKLMKWTEECNTHGEDVERGASQKLTDFINKLREQRK